MFFKTYRTHLQEQYECYKDESNWFGHRPNNVFNFLWLYYVRHLRY